MKRRAAAELMVSDFPSASLHDVLFKLRLAARESEIGDEEPMGHFGPSDGRPNSKPEDERYADYDEFFVAAIRDLDRLSGANIARGNLPATSVAPAQERRISPDPKGVMDVIEAIGRDDPAQAFAAAMTTLRYIERVLGNGTGKEQATMNGLAIAAIALSAILGVGHQVAFMILGYLPPAQAGADAP